MLEKHSSRRVFQKGKGKVTGYNPDEAHVENSIIDIFDIILPWKVHKENV